MSKNDYKQLWKKIKPALDSINSLYLVMILNNPSDEDQDRLMHTEIHFARGVMISMLRKYKIEIPFFSEAIEYFFLEHYSSRRDPVSKKKIYAKENALKLAKESANLTMMDNINVPAEKSFHEENVALCVEEFAKLANNKSIHFKNPIKKFFGDLFD